MNARRLAIVFGVLLLPLVLILSFAAEEGHYRVYVPTGYITEVDRLIGADKLFYECRSEEIQPRGLTDAESFFLSHSYLDDDLRRWNAGDRQPFEVERQDLGGGRCDGKVLRINKSFHKQRLPAYTASSWRGRLYLRQGQPTLSLSSPDRRLEVTRAPWERLPLSASSFSDVWIRPGQGDERTEKMALKWREAGRMFVSLEHVGDDVAAEVYQERPALLLNGCPVRTGARLRLDSGDWVWLQEEGSTNEQYHVESGDEAGLVSFVTTVNGELRRRTLGNRLEMADELTRAVDTAVVAGAEHGRDDFDVHLTLDAFFQDFLTRHLASFCRQRYGRRPLRAAVTLLEPVSGRVLALGSYPSAGDLESLRLKSDVHRLFLGENHNFLVHPIGSATKPFLAAAALATRPRLAQLTVPCHSGGGPAPRLLGYDFGRFSLPGDCGDDGAPIDFRRFLEVSSNRYMLNLGLLALAEWQNGLPLPDPGHPMISPDGYSLSGTPAVYRPRLVVVKAEDRAGATEIAGVQDMPFYQHFRDLFGHSIHYESLPPDRALEMSYWNPITNAAGGSGREVALAFSTVTPERVNLRANLIQQARQDLYTSLLGLGNNRWSNVQLAESMARLLTGRKVDAHLIERVVVPPPPQEPGYEQQEEKLLWDLEDVLGKEQPEPLPLAAESRQLILEGMSRVVEGSRGTAHALMKKPLEALNSRAPVGVYYSALGKTGTPSTEFQIVSRSPVEPSPGAIHIDSRSGSKYVNHGVLVLVLTRTAEGKSESLILTLFIEAQGASSEAVALASDLLKPLAEAYWPQDWMEAQGITRTSQP